MAAGQRLICAAGELADGGKGVRFTVDREGRAIPAFAIRYRGRAYAYINECGHVPAELDWQPGEFFDLSGLYLICAIHGALYAPDSGRCLGGRCQGRGLKPLPVQETDGNLFLMLENNDG
ncbi:Rieske (2Fe-2S) protein [Azonexus fungiphilus]|uniref:Rieske (2Fe-2S) protein n=1 Tax=Azonexus fungiphilus TaxID=146940 RepID=UPI00156B6BFC|nr:Rieske 2Fe-2S domain-containing protein [Azonexus fungiphilus]NHC07591.1 Rieske 2Fe-2S domain-containing protein [Azonexus fungiphilus]